MEGSNGSIKRDDRVRVKLGRIGDTGRFTRTITGTVITVSEGGGSYGVRADDPDPYGRILIWEVPLDRLEVIR